MADGAPNQQQQQQQFRMLIQQPKYQQLIRPDNIAKLPGLNDEGRTRMTSGARQLWNVIQTKPPEDALHQEAIRKLQQLTQTLMNQAKRATSQQNVQGGNVQSDAGRPQSQGNTQQIQQNGGLPSNQSQQAQSQSQAPPPPQPQQQQQQQQQQAQQQQRPQTQRQQAQQMSEPQQQNPGNGHVQVPEKFRQQAESMPWLIPPGQQKEPAYRAELTRRYAEALWKRESAQAILQNVENVRNQGKELPPNVAQEAQKASSTLQTCQTFIDQINNQQNSLRQQQQSQSQQAARNANGAAIANAQNVQNTSASAQTAQNMRPLPNAALEAARQQQMSRPPSGSPVTAQPASAASPNPNMSGTPTQQQNFQNLQRPQQAFAQSPQVSAPNSAAPIAQNPQQPQQAQVPSAQPQTVPLTHQGAMDAAAKSYQNNGTAQQPQSATQVQGQQMRPEMDKTNASRWTIDKNFKVEPPRPVQMGAQRPTMAGPNGGPMGMIGQPALQQPPTYSLHGPGDRVLDKKKLDELVRQVCGAGDGTGQQSLHPEVEESVLQLADEFFDNVVTQACRLAKLRGGNTLEIRDIQLVLQKQYNIRIPGYSTDEVRTVRKVQPAASYLQKMNAIQAAKVMGGKADI